MSSLRSSVNTASSKQPWGTLLKPNFGLGYQKLNSYELDQTIERLTTPRKQKERVYEQPKLPNLDKVAIDGMLERLTTVKDNHVTDFKRTQQHSIYSDMGVVNAFAWKGYN